MLQDCANISVVSESWCSGSGKEENTCQSIEMETIKNGQSHSHNFFPGLGDGFFRRPHHVLLHSCAFWPAYKTRCGFYACAHTYTWKQIKNTQFFQTHRPSIPQFANAAGSRKKYKLASFCVSPLRALKWLFPSIPLF